MRPRSTASALWSALWAAGQEHGLVAGGYRAIESLRLEKGYRVWSTDVTPETNPYEAGLGFCVKLDKPGGFEGAEALREVKERGVARRLRCLTLDDPRAVALGSEPVRVGDEVCGRVTSGGFGYTVGASIAYAYLPVDVASAGHRGRGQRLRRLGARRRGRPAAVRPEEHPRARRRLDRVTRGRLARKRLYLSLLEATCRVECRRPSRCGRWVRGRSAG